MSDQPHYPYRDGDHAVLGPEVTAAADGMTIRWKGANYRRDHGQPTGTEAAIARVRQMVDQLHTDAASARADGYETSALAIEGSARRVAYALDQPAPAATQAAEPATVTDPAYLRQQYAAAIRRWWDADDDGAEEIATAVMAVRDRHLQQLRQRLQLADELLATRDAELAAAKKTARGIGAWGVLQAIEQALPQGPTVAEAAADDARWWNGEKAGE